MRSSLNLLMLQIAATAMFFAGCATNRVDWNSRVGIYSYEQAVNELGRPSKLEPLPDGKTMAVWISRYRISGTAPGMDSGFYNYSPSFGQSPPDYHESKLRLTFTTNSVLSAWSRD